MNGKVMRRTAFLLAGVMLCLSGCGSGKSNLAGQEGEQGLSLASGDGQNKEANMGRYLERDVILPEEVYAGNYPSACIQRMDNGDLALMEKAAGLFLSSDQGTTWTWKSVPWYHALDAYIAHTALAPNGAAAVIYDPYEDLDHGEEDMEEGMEESETDEDGIGEENQGQVMEYDPEYLYADPEGNTKQLEAPASDTWLHQFWFDRESRLYACDMNGKVYEMDVEHGTAKMLFETEGLSDYVCFTERYMVMTTSRSEVILYDLKDGMMAKEDQVLQEFVRENAGNSMGANADGFHMVTAAGEQEDVLYLAYSGGLYRHAVGGSVMEQLSDGSISSLSDPQRSLCGFAVLSDDEFLVLYDHARLCRYVYDPDMPAVPEEQVGIYSLTEDYTIRQAVSLFQKTHPEIYIRYEVGLPGDGSMTTEDAVRNLNTRIMSGSGPDLLMLDGLPFISYAEKGVLTDLSRIVHDMEGEDLLFGNLVDACRIDGRLYYLPIRFRLPLLVGDQDSIRKVSDLPSLADAVEALRTEEPEGALIGLRTAEEALRTLMLASSGAWVEPVTKSLDQEKLTEFLQSARRIYQAETAGMDAEELLEYQEHYEEKWQSDVASEGMYYAVASANAIDIAMETQKLGAGVLFQVDGDFSTVTTVASQEEGVDYVPWQGQVPNGFLPRCMMGICAGAEEKEPVMEFFSYLYESELQDMDLPSGFPIRLASFEKLRVNPRPEQESSGIVLISDENDLFSIDIQWCREEDFERLKDMVLSASSVCTGDTRIEQIVWELGVKALDGNADVEDTVAEIMKKAAIYLAE